MPTIDLGEPTGEAAEMTASELDARLSDAKTRSLDAAADKQYGDYLGDWGKGLEDHLARQANE